MIKTNFIIYFLILNCLIIELVKSNSTIKLDKATNKTHKEAKKTHKEANKFNDDEATTQTNDKTNDELIVIDLIPGPYCIDNEISYCLHGDFRKNITSSLVSSNGFEESYQQFCDHLTYGLNCLTEYSKIMCGEKQEILKKVQIVIDPINQLKDQMCGKAMTPLFMKRLFQSKKCFKKYDELETCLVKFYYSTMTFIHQDASNKLFCDNIIRCFDDCFQTFFEDCDKTVKFDKNDLIKSLINRYPVCENTVGDAIERKFPSDTSDSGLTQFGLNSYLFYSLLSVTFFNLFLKISKICLISL